jgi:hypothetical protein
MDRVMQSREGTQLLALAPSGARINVWTATAAEAAALAEAIHEARPRWRVQIANQETVFSREGKVVDLVNAGPKNASARERG